MYAYLLGDTGDIVALSADFGRLTAFAEKRSEGEIAACDWRAEMRGAWSCVHGRYDRGWFSHPSTEAIIVRIDPEEVV